MNKLFSLFTNIFLITAIFATITSCDSSTIYSNIKPLKDKTWDANEILKYNIEINDTISKHNFFINIRNSADYSFMNLYVFMTSFYPDKSLSKDTIEFILARNDGKWLGKGRNIIDNKILLKQNLVFNKLGTYSFEFEQAMRVKELQGIEDFGITIEKQNN